MTNIRETSVDDFDSDVVTVLAGSNSVLHTFTLLGLPFVISALIENLDANAFDQFLVEAQLVEDGSWFTYITDAQIGTGTAIANVLRSVSTDLGALVATTGAGLLSIEGAGLHAVRFAASKATGNGTGRARGYVVLRP
jgi:hypothetical protein